MDSLNKMQTWSLAELPEGRKPLSCRWIFKIKEDGRMKARLVARGYDQLYGIDYTETFAPVARHASIKILISLAARGNYYIKTFDIKTAFLNGKLNEEIYMLQPEGFNDGSGRVCKLNKSIYGLKQAPKSWNTTFTEYLKKLNFEDTDDDPCLFYNESKSIMMTVFVDDGFIIGRNKQEVENLLKRLSLDFEIVSEGPKQGKLHYLGMEIKLLNHGIFVSQPNYTKKIIERFGFEDAYEVSTPMKPGMITNKMITDKGLIGKPYREAVGSLLFHTTISRPDISFAINYLSRQVCNPKMSHWKMIERVFRYLRGTENFGIFFDGSCKLQVYTDANYGGDEQDRHCTSGILVENGGPIV